MEPTTITATDLARRLSEVLSRVKYGRESFVVVRNGQLVATIEPASPAAAPGITIDEFVRRVGHLTVPDGLGEAIEEAYKVFREPGDEHDPWVS
jgi:antitoxin (DNA-binding transcriptional repressor) of toxin-antitoxin stability system